MIRIDQQICAWGGIFDFWMAAGAFFAWLVTMTWVVRRAIASSADVSIRPD